MKPQEKIKRTIKPKGLYNLNYIEKGVGLRNYKLYAFVNGKERLTDDEALCVLAFVKRESKIK